MPKNQLYPKDLKTLGDHIRKRRLDDGLLQRDVARKLGVDVESVCHWETGRSQPQVHHVPAIIIFLGYYPWEPIKGLPSILRRYRMMAGLSQEALAANAKVDESTLAKWERGTSYPMPDTLTRLRRFFECKGLPMPEFAEHDTYSAVRRSAAARKASRSKKKRC